MRSTNKRSTRLAATLKKFNMTKYITVKVLSIVIRASSNRALVSCLKTEIAKVIWEGMFDHPAAAPAET